MQETWDLGSEMSQFALMTAQRETEITLLPSFACSSLLLLTVIRDSWYCLLRFICPSDKGRYCCRCLKAFAVEEVSDNKLDEGQESTTKKKPSSSARDCTDAVVCYLSS